MALTKYTSSWIWPPPPSPGRSRLLPSSPRGRRSGPPAARRFSPSRPTALKSGWSIPAAPAWCWASPGGWIPPWPCWRRVGPWTFWSAPARRFWPSPCPALAPPAAPRAMPRLCARPWGSPCKRWISGRRRPCTFGTSVTTALPRTSPTKTPRPGSAPRCLWTWPTAPAAWWWAPGTFRSWPWAGPPTTGTICPCMG